MPWPLQPSEQPLCPLDPLRFLCDEMLQGVGEWLRVAGYDTETPLNGTVDRDVLAQAVAEDRWLVTRDRELLLHREAPAYVILLSTGDQEENLQELTRRLDLDWLKSPFSRCKRCNTPLKQGPYPGSPPLPELDLDSIYHCPRCRQTYWEGSHVRRMRDRLRHFSRWRPAIR